MRIHTHISVLALAAAMLAVPQPAQAQLSLDLDLGGDVSGEGLGLDAELGLGLGDSEVNVDTGVRLGGDSLVDADVGVGLDTSGDADSQVDVDAQMLGRDGAVDVDAGIDGDGSGPDGLDVDANADVIADDAVLDADLSIGSGAGAGAGASDDNARPRLGVRLSALDDAGRADAVLGQIDAPYLDGADLDALINDRSVSILALVDLLAAEDVAAVRARIAAGGEGRDQLLAAIAASVELGAILQREGVAPDQVVSLAVDANGSAELVVLDPAVADDGNASRAETGLAELDAVLDAESGEDVLVTADLLDVLDRENLSPEAVIGLGAGGDGVTRVFVDASLGEGAGTPDGLAQVEITLGAGSGGDESAGNGSDSGADDGAGGGADDGNDTGGDTGNGTDGTAGGADDGSTGDDASSSDGMPVRDGPDVTLAEPIDVARIGCAAGLDMLSMVEPPSPSELGAVDSVALVNIVGCAATLRQDELAALRAAIRASAALSARVDNAGLALDDLVGGTLANATLTLYFKAAGDLAA